MVGKVWVCTPSLFCGHILPVCKERFQHCVQGRKDENCKLQWKAKVCLYSVVGCQLRGLVMFALNQLAWVWEHCSRGSSAGQLLCYFLVISGLGEQPQVLPTIFPAVFPRRAVKLAQNPEGLSHHWLAVQRYLLPPENYLHRQKEERAERHAGVFAFEFHVELVLRNLMEAFALLLSKSVIFCQCFFLPSVLLIPLYRESQSPLKSIAGFPLVCVDLGPDSSMQFTFVCTTNGQL